MNDLKSIAREIHYAIKGNDIDLAIKLLNVNEKLGILSYKTPFGTWLHDASAHGRQILVEYLVNKGVDINERGGILGGNALNEAVKSQHIDLINYLLDLNVEMIIDESEHNSLFTAIYVGNLTIVKILIFRGIDYKISYTSDYMNNMDAEAFALERGEKEIASYLNFLKQ
ncbi:ankyrin repeat domain-containing protein [Acinetobacter sp. WA-87]|uniref:ankyrin repeat domain-containing protein n=1 Tax=Acinetobacter sp. WA-87 TaxID=3153556 RepID=UPI0032632D8B